VTSFELPGRDRISWQRVGNLATMDSATRVDEYR
jgi:hypothetical protein